MENPKGWEIYIHRIGQMRKLEFLTGTYVGMGCDYMDARRLAKEQIKKSKNQEPSK